MPGNLRRSPDILRLMQCFASLRHQHQLFGDLRFHHISLSFHSFLRLLKNSPPDPTAKKTEDGIQKAAANPLKLSKLQINSEYPHPGYRTKGRSVALWANYLPIALDPSLVLYRYAIDVRPSASGRKLAQIIRLVFEAPEIASMAANLVTDFKSTTLSRERLQLANNSIVIHVLYRSELEDEPAEDAAQYRARILYTNTLRVSQLIEYLELATFNQYDEKLSMVQVLNIFLSHYPRTSPDLASRSGNTANKTFPLSNKAPLVGGLTAIRDLFSSVRLAAGRVLVNVNVSHGAFYNSGRLMDLTDSFHKENGKSLSGLNEFLRGIRGRTLHLPERRNRSGERIVRPKTIYSLSRPSDGTDSPQERRPKVYQYGAGSKDVKFWLEPHQASASRSPLRAKKKKDPQLGSVPSPAGPARLTSVYDYSLDTYNIRDRRLDLPIINIDSPWKLSPAQTQDMINFAVRPPLQNALSIVNQGADTVGSNPERNSMLVSSYHKTIIGRIWNMISTKLIIPGQRLRKWSYLLVLDKRVQDSFPDVQNFQLVVNKLQAILLTTGVLIEAPFTGKMAKVDKGETVDLDNRLREAAKNLDLLYVILPEKDSRWCPAIKRLCDVEYGLQTICSVGSKLAMKKGQTQDKYDKNLDQYMRNAAMKFNLKLGGTNHTVGNLRSSLVNEDTIMIVGLDVTHPTGSQVSPATAPSVAGMIQSRWGKEEIDSLDSVLKRHLNLWKTFGKHASFPENIIIYRDGIFEGQYTKCLNVYPREMQEKNLPKFTIVIVSKRHHTRFYPTEVKTADKNGNTLPCTVVDRCITDPHCFSFFLQPHSAIHGTARNTFYFVILDVVFSPRYQGKLPPKYKNTAETVQGLTLSLSYLVGRATKGARVCCPTRYADLEPSSKTSSVASGASAVQATDKDVLVHEKIRIRYFISIKAKKAISRFWKQQPHMRLNLSSDYEGGQLCEPELFHRR
ncbi:ribonuclease H-like domain-containing protein [Aspergillus bertholletiae]|uniref:Ribonuclease H-like domain-containing protein n=1 Tax=Aspergillus bertholletiae TaxID=1226010 RepID=A0A5N7AZZ0_9EURO|nr:ribonuclease H-like domain-containing protein [Aspergillus bertholletiae]